ncbi:hypothetical protein V8V80_25125 [Niallia taxi]
MKKAGKCFSDEKYWGKLGSLGVFAVYEVLPLLKARFSNQGENKDNREH